MIDVNILWQIIYIQTAKQELLTSFQKILWKDAQIDFENITLLYFSITFEGVSDVYIELMMNSPGGIKTKLGLPSGKYRNILGSRKKYWDSAFGLTQYFFLSPNIFLYLPAFRPNLL